jgi:hypothetical protein
MAYEYTERLSGVDGKAISYGAGVEAAKADAQAIADSKGEAVTGTYIFGTGERFVYTAYPTGSSKPAPDTPAPSSSNDYRINPDITAAMQRGNIQQPGFFGSQEMKPSNDQFNQAVNIAANLAGLAAALKSKPTPPSNYVRTPTNYVLTELERQAISSKSRELASFGVVPVDVLDQFFYILAVNESQQDLNYIAQTVGIPELGQSRYVRNIRDITLIPDIYKIGYLANGVASVTNQFAGKYSNMQQYGDHTQSSIGGILQAADVGLSLGVMGANILNSSYSLNGYSGPLRNSPGLSSGAINNSINAYQLIASGNPAASLSPSTISNVLNPAANIQAQATTIGPNLIGGLLSQNPLGGAMSALGPLGGIAAGMLLSKAGGNALGGFMSEVLLGARIATSKLANNPMLTSPSYAGKAFFGEAPVALPAIDQVFCRKIGAFGTAQGGGGVVSFGMQNFASLGGALSIASVVSRFMTGSTTPPAPTTFFGQQVAMMTNNLCNNLNVPTTSDIELRRSDNAIPFMIGMSATIVGENFSPFGSSPFTNGWRLASSTANDIQRYNPRYLEACRTSL